MPFPTPAYPFDASRLAPHASPPAVTPKPPIVLGGVLRPDSPFLDALPAVGEAPAERVPEISPRAAAQVAARRMIPDAATTHAKPGANAAELHEAEVDDAEVDDAEMADAEHAGADDRNPFDVVPVGSGSDEWPAFGARIPTPATSLPAVPAAPELPAGPFDRAAVERAQGRAARRAEHVEATVASDDGGAEHVCDVTAWLADATLPELRALADDHWSGAAAAELAEALAEEDPEVADVVRHARRTDAEVVIEIDGRAAMAWLAHHRPAVADALADALDDASGDEGADED